MEDNKTSVNASAGLGFFELLQLAFIILKLCGIIKWRWVLVLAPTWIGLIMFIIIMIVVIVIWHKKE